MSTQGFCLVGTKLHVLCLDIVRYYSCILVCLGTKGYRDASCNGFLRRIKLGFKYPETGADDYQVHTRDACYSLPLIGCLS